MTNNKIAHTDTVMKDNAGFILDGDRTDIEKEAEYVEGELKKILELYKKLDLVPIFNAVPDIPNLGKFSSELLAAEGINRDWHAVSDDKQQKKQRRLLDPLEDPGNWYDTDMDSMKKKGGKKKEKKKKKKSQPSGEDEEDLCSIDDGGSNCGDDNNYDVGQFEENPDALLPSMSRFTSDGKELEWVNLYSGNCPYLRASAPASVASGQYGHLSYVTNNVEEEKDLQLKRLVYRLEMADEKLGRFNRRMKIEDMYFNDQVVSGDQCCVEAALLFSRMTNQCNATVVSGLLTKYEVDIENVEGMVEYPEAWKNTLLRFLEKQKTTFKNDEKGLNHIDAEIAHLEKVEYIYMQNNTCSCGCATIFVNGKDVERCKVCKLKFYSDCMFVKDRGFCKICALAPDTKTPGRNIHTLHAYISFNHLTRTLYT